MCMWSACSDRRVRECEHAMTYVAPAATCSPNPPGCGAYRALPQGPTHHAQVPQVGGEDVVVHAVALCEADGAVVCAQQLREAQGLAAGQRPLQRRRQGCIRRGAREPKGDECTCRDARCGRGRCGHVRAVVCAAGAQLVR